MDSPSPGLETPEAARNWLPLKIAAERLNVSVHLLYGWCAKRRIVHRRIGGRVWIELYQAQKAIVRDFPAVEGTHHAE